MVLAVTGVVFLVISILMFMGALVVTLGMNPSKATRFAITLKQNEGSFIALRTERHWDRWTFEDVRITPTNPGAAVMQAAPGKLYVPYRNILYYQEIMETANADE